MGTRKKNPATMTTEEKVEFLKDEGTKAGANAFLRVSVAHEVLMDPEWTKSVGGRNKALTIIKEDFLHDLCAGNDGSAQWLMQVYEAFPHEAEWKKRGYNIVTLKAELHEREKKKRKEGRPRATLARIDELEEEISDWKEKEKAWIGEREQLLAEISDLREEIERLKEELVEEKTKNARLEGRLEQVSAA